MKLSILVFLVTVLMACSSTNSYYVSKTGNNGNPGTQAAPFANIEKALETIRNKKQKGKDIEFRIVVRSGRYTLDKSLTFDTVLSATCDNPLVIMAYEGEEVIISGGRYFEQEALENPDAIVLSRIIDEKARKHIKVLDLKAQGITDFGQTKHVGFCRPILPAGIELYQNDRNMTLSSYPSDGYIKIDKVIDSGSKPRNNDFSDKGGVFQYDSYRPSLWKETGDLWVQGMFGTVWADDKLKVASMDTLKKTIATVEPHLYGITGGHFRFMNIFEEINKPGDYFIDRKEGKAYIYPFSEKGDISVSILETPLVSIEGASNVRFKHIIFENGRGLGAYIEKGTDNRFTHCTFRNFGSYAVSFGKGTTPFEQLAHEGTGKPWSGHIGSLRQHIYTDVTYNRQAGEHNGLVFCKIYNTGAGGVSLGGGDIRSLTSANNYVDGCEIYHTGLRYQTYAPSIDISGVGNRVSNCTIYDSPHSGIIYYGNEHLIENNEIYDVLLESDDGGAIYTGRDVTSIGTVIRNNYIHHAGSKNPLYHHGYWHAIYLDDISGEVTIEDNVFAHTLAGVLISGRNIICRNNILVDCERSIVIQTRPWMDLHDKRLQQVGAFEEIWKERYPHIQKIQLETKEERGKYWGTKSLDNVSIGSKNRCTIFDRIDTTYTEERGNLDYPMEKVKDFFVDPENGNYTIKEGSTLLKEHPGLKDIDFSKFLKKD